jgi:peptidoglycan/xylan/chitin deacetylase (PgdA/CDA1 family)
MKTSITILMYHAVADVRGEYPGADAHYGVSQQAFAAQLRLVAAADRRCSSVARLLAGTERPDTTVAMTFDDGHASNRNASELIANAGGSADFFVNPSAVGTVNHLSWSELRGMAADGMSIQSHGFRHRYLDELTPNEVRSELFDSKKAIEDELGLPVTIFAPPGGRVAPGLDRVACECGYAAVCTSRVGLWNSVSAWDIPRLAVLHSTSEQQFMRWIRQAPMEVLGLRARHQLLSRAKRILGNRGYERLRQSLLRMAS